MEKATLSRWSAVKMAHCGSVLVSTERLSARHLLWGVIAPVACWPHVGGNCRRGAYQLLCKG